MYIAVWGKLEAVRRRPEAGTGHIVHISFIGLSRIGKSRHRQQTVQWGMTDNGYKASCRKVKIFWNQTVMAATPQYCVCVKRQ